MQDIINESWGDDDGVVSYVRIEGTNLYRVSRHARHCVYDDYLDRHDPYINSDEEDDRRDVYTIKGRKDESDTSKHASEVRMIDSDVSMQAASSNKGDTPTTESAGSSASCTPTTKARRVQLPYQPVLTPAGRCARNEGYLWRHKPDGSYDNRPCGRT